MSFKVRIFKIIYNIFLSLNFFLKNQISSNLTSTIKIIAIPATLLTREFMAPDFNFRFFDLFLTTLLSCLISVVSFSSSKMSYSY